MALQVVVMMYIPTSEEEREGNINANTIFLEVCQTGFTNIYFLLFGHHDSVMVNLNCQLDWIKKCRSLRGFWVCQ